MGELLSIIVFQEDHIPLYKKLLAFNNLPDQAKCLLRHKRHRRDTGESEVMRDASEGCGGGNYTDSSWESLRGFRQNDTICRLMEYPHV